MKNIFRLVIVFGLVVDSSLISAQAETPAAEPSGNVCLITPSESKVEDLDVAVVSDRYLANRPTIQLTFTSTHATAGLATVTATVFSELELRTLEDLRTVPVEPGVATVLNIPVDLLRLPTQPLAVPGDILLTLKLEYSETHEETVPQVVRLRFQSAPGGWQIAARQHEDGRLGEPGHAATGPALVSKRANVDDAAEGNLLKLCINQVSTFTDSGVGEAYWTNNFPTARTSRGSQVEVRRSGNLLFSGFLGDGLGSGDPGAGCTGNFSGSAANATYEVTIESRGLVQNNTVEVVEEGVGLIRSHTANIVASNGTFNVTLNAAAAFDEFNVYMPAAYAIWRHAGGMQSQFYRYTIDAAGGSRFDRFQDRIYIHRNHHFKKFVIVHEAGHALGDFGTGNNNFKLVDLNCEDFGDAVCGASGGQHSMASKEFARCALGEGFAHFYSADVFNDHYQTDCQFHYYKNEFGNDSTPTVDCEDANGSFVERFMEANCPLPWGGYGTEIDWMRALWDLHTDGIDPPGFTEIVEWLDSANVWGDVTAFDELDSEADEIGGNLNRNWDTAKTQNGIDWSSGSRPADRIGVYRPANRLFLLDKDGGGTWNPPADTGAPFGIAGDIPLVGDWNGDGDDDIGVYRPADRRFLLDLDESLTWTPATDSSSQMGVVGDVPLIGDWNGDGDDDIGVYRPAARLFLLDLDESGTWEVGSDLVFLLGLVGDVPLIGDWNGDGDDNIGVYRPSNRVFLVDFNENGTWNAGVDPGYLMGLVGDTPLAGDWNGDGDDEIGIYRPANRVFLLDADEGGTWTPATDLGYSFGLTGDQPLTGAW